MKRVRFVKSLALWTEPREFVRMQHPTPLHFGVRQAKIFLGLLIISVDLRGAWPAGPRIGNPEPAVLGTARLGDGEHPAAGIWRAGSQSNCAVVLAALSPVHRGFAWILLHAM